MGFGKDVARSDVEKESGEDSKVDEKRVLRKREKQGGYGSGNRSYGIGQKKCLRLFRGILMREHQRDGIHSVREIVGDYGEGDYDADRSVHLESESDTHAVQERVPDERCGRKHAHLRMVVVGVIPFVVMVDEYEFFKHVENEKARREGDHGIERIVVPFFREFENFRKDVERNDAQKDSGRKGHDIVEPVFETNGNEPPGESGKERCGCESCCGKRHFERNGISNIWIICERPDRAPEFSRFSNAGILTSAFP